MESVQIFIRRPGDPIRRLQLSIDQSDTVKSISEKVSTKIGLSPECMKILFCGRRLSNETSIKDLKLGPQTCLTVTIIDEIPALKDSPFEDADNFEIVNHSNHPEIPNFQQKTSSFYVFCKCCEKLNAAKLRAYCSDCNSSSIEFVNEPSGWDDVIGSGKIKVNCQQCTKESTARFVFKCIECSNEGAVLSNIRPNRADNECLICGEVEPILVALDCMHTACVPCFSAYLEQINDQWLFVYKNDVGFTMRCIMVDCDCYIKDQHHFYLMGIDNYKKFQHTAAEKFLHIQEGYHYCPYIGCGACFTVDEDNDAQNDEQSDRFMCPECQRVFCLKCKNQGECICEKTADESQETIKSISKPCPKCRVQTERSGGCSHMRCSNCTFEWCYFCEKEWGDDCQWDHWFD